MSASTKKRHLLAKRRNKQKNKQKNKFKTETKYTYTLKSAKPADVDKIAYEVFGALTYSSKKSF